MGGFNFQRPSDGIYHPTASRPRPTWRMAARENPGETGCDSATISKVGIPISGICRARAIPFAKAIPIRKPV